MPKEISHILIANEIFQGLEGSGMDGLARIIRRNVASFYLGAIIPDAFFYDMTPLVRISKNNLWISRALHMKNAASNDKKAVGFFDAISTTSPAWEAKLAFAAGVVTHTVSDRMVHGVIDHVTKGWDQKDGPAMATHRQMETLIDMVLLQLRHSHPRSFDLAKIVHVQDPIRDILFGFHLSHLTQDSGLVDSSLVRALKRAHAQQILLLKVFASRGLYQTVTLSNRLAAGRLGPWSSLFYPETVEPKAFSILDSLDLEGLTDGRSFSGPLSSLIKAIVRDAIILICAGVQRLG
jgi:hypothetical protein